MTESHKKILDTVREIFGESTDPETIKKFKAVEEAVNTADQETTTLTEKYGNLAKEYREAILGTGTHTPPDDKVTPPKPQSFEDALAAAVKAAQPKA